MMSSMPTGNQRGDSGSGRYLKTWLAILVALCPLMNAAARDASEAMTPTQANPTLMVNQQSTVQAPAEMKLTGVTPSPVIASGKPQRIILKGVGFSKDSMVALSRAGKATVLPQEQVEFLSDTTLGIDIVTGGAAAEWAVQVGTLDNRRSNVLFFKVTRQAQQPTTTANPSLVQKQPIEHKVAVAGIEKSVPQVPTGLVNRATTAMDKTASAGVLLGNEWLAKQPKQNFTLQLLASSSRYNVAVFVRQHPQLNGPLAGFSMDKDGRRFHVLTQGSYPSRDAAEQAASQLPDGLRGWPRTLASVQQVMLKESPAHAQKSATGGPDSTLIKDTAWIWSQDPSRFTVQLAAAGSEQAIEAVMHRSELPGELVVLLTQRQGKPWYVLIYGSFTSREAARGTIERLPAPLQKAGPWLRSFASLQSDLSQAIP